MPRLGTVAAALCCPGVGDKPHRLGGFGAVNAPSTVMKKKKGGPAVSAPSRRSFGTRLIGSLGQQLKGQVQLDYEPTGFVYGLNVPMTSLVAPS